MTDQMTISMVLKTWYSTVKRTNALFEKLTDEEMLNEIAPNRNRAIYLLGHLTAVHDMMLPLLGFESQLYPQLKASFIRIPDRSEEDKFSVQNLREFWKNVNAKLATHYEALQEDEWFQKHTSISDEDFNKEPHRNKLNVVINRTNHLSYHLGQLGLLTK